MSHQLRPAASTCHARSRHVFRCGIHVHTPIVSSADMWAGPHVPTPEFLPFHASLLLAAARKGWPTTQRGRKALLVAPPLNLTRPTSCTGNAQLELRLAGACFSIKGAHAKSFRNFFLQAKVTSLTVKSTLMMRSLNCKSRSGNTVTTKFPRSRCVPSCTAGAKWVGVAQRRADSRAFGLMCYDVLRYPGAQWMGSPTIVLCVLAVVAS